MFLPRRMTDLKPRHTSASNIGVWYFPLELHFEHKLRHAVKRFAPVQSAFYSSGLDGGDGSIGAPSRLCQPPSWAWYNLLELHMAHWMSGESGELWYH